MTEEVSWDPANTPVGTDPKHTRAMAWKVDDDHRIDYGHGSLGGVAHHNFFLSRLDDKTTIGALHLHNNGDIAAIEVHPQLRRQGIATKMYNFVTKLHEDIPGIPAPVHSDERTESGQKWAASVGGPGYSPSQEVEHVPDSDYLGRNWKALRNADTHKLTEHLNQFVAKAHAAGLDDYTTESVNRLHKIAKDHIKMASEYDPSHFSYGEHLRQAHMAIDDMGMDVNDITHGELDEDHENLQEHIGRLY